jgi:predicted AAA+ superfamily ATPase
LDTTALESVLRTYAEAPLPELVPRDVRLLSRDRKADTLVGMRRSGKTFVMFGRMRALLAEGVPREHMMYMSLDDDRLGEPDAETLSRSLEAFYRMSPDARSTRSYLFFDEIQLANGWERFVRRVLDTENAQVVIGGSSAKLLSSEVHTSLRGRGHAVEVLPFGFREVARARGLEPSGRSHSARTRSALEALSADYMVRGGFPEVLDAEPIPLIETLHEYVELVVLRDVVERHGVTNIRALRHLVRGIFAANSGQLSVSSLHGAMVSQGIKVTKNTLLDYLSHLVDAYLCFLVPIRSQSEKQRLVNPKKVYSVDPGLAAAMTAGGSANRGALLENAVYLEIRRRHGWLADGRVSYYRTRSGREVDFAIEPITGGEHPHLVQVCADLERTATVSREAQALDEAMSETGVARATLVTLVESGELQMSSGVVEVVPFWEWALRDEL